MRPPIKTHRPPVDAEPTVEPADIKPAPKGKSVDRADPHPSLPRRSMFRERVAGEVEP